MATLNPILKRALPTLLLLCIAQNAAASKARNSVSTLNIGAVERDFDTIRGFYSFDPATGIWSKIEDFKTVDILEDTAEQREDNYIYRSFWSYDALARRWRKVDIRDYGYKLETIATTAGEEEEAEEEPAKTPSRFWKNWVLGLRGGGGLTFHENSIGHFKLLEADRIFQVQAASQKKSRKVTLLHWPGVPPQTDPDSKTGAIPNKAEGVTKYNEVPIGKNIVFTGQGWNFPITLFTHYTFFDRVRLGAGFEFAFNLLRELRPIEDAANLPKFKVKLSNELFHTTAWFGLLGIKIFHTLQQDIALDIQAGESYNIFSLKRFFETKKYIDKGWMVGAGISYERKLNNYFRWIARIGADWKQHDATPPEVRAKEKEPFIILRQIAAHVELGIQVSFGADTEEEELEAEEGDDTTSPNDSDEEQLNKLKETGRAIEEAQDQRERLESKIKWRMR